MSPDDDDQLKVIRKNGFDLIMKTYVAHGGFTDEFTRINEQKKKQLEDEELDRQVKSTTVSVNEDTLKYSKKTRRISLIALIIAGLALLIELLKALKILPSG